MALHLLILLSCMQNNHIKQMLLPGEQTHSNDCLRPWTLETS